MSVNPKNGWNIQKGVINIEKTTHVMKSNKRGGFRYL